MEHLASPSEAAGILQLSTPVTEIVIHPEHFSIITPRITFSANAVILAVPLGCLQHSTIDFEPPLPRRVQSAIADLGFGNLEKVFLKFERAWWMVPSQQHPPDTCFFLPPTTLPSFMPKKLLEFFSLARLPVNPQPVLAVYLAGEWSTYMESQSTTAIAQLFQTYFLPLLPGYTPDCIILDLVRTTWKTDPWTYGSYTHIPVGSIDGINDLGVLGENIFHLERAPGGLWFAGEHAGTWDLGTVNGAMASGKSAAFNTLRDLGEALH